MQNLQQVQDSWVPFSLRFGQYTFIRVLQTKCLASSKSIHSSRGFKKGIKQPTHWCTLLDTIVDQKHVELCAGKSIHFEKLAGRQKSCGCHGLQYQMEHSRSRFQPCQSRRIRSELLQRKSARLHPWHTRGSLKRLLATRNCVGACYAGCTSGPKSIAKQAKRSSVCLTSGGSLSATWCQSICIRMYPLRMLEIWEAMEFGWSSVELIAWEVNNKHLVYTRIYSTSQTDTHTHTHTQKKKRLQVATTMFWWLWSNTTQF